MTKGKGTIVSEKDGASPVGLPFKYYSQRDWLPDPTLVVVAAAAAVASPPAAVIRAAATASEARKGPGEGDDGLGAVMGDGRSDASAVDRLFAGIDADGDGKVCARWGGVDLLKEQEPCQPCPSCHSCVQVGRREMAAFGRSLTRVSGPGSSGSSGSDMEAWGRGLVDEMDRDGDVRGTLAAERAWQLRFAERCER
jgi:hypothetical protein